jgi:hypothetical protein
MDPLDDFATLVEHAKPYARQCGALDNFAQACFEEVERSGEPAFFLTTQKHLNEPHRFPAALEMWGYDENKGQAFVVATMDITRPDYKNNSEGFKGNHLVVALLEEVKKKVVDLVPDGIAILTSQSSWRSLIRGSGYTEIKSTLRNLTHRLA